jgi:hypothetical protein
LTDESKKSRLFKDYSRRVNYVMDVYLKFVTSWYGRSKEFIEVFMNPTEMLQLAPAVNSVLAGNEGASFAIRWRMRLFYFFVNAQRHFAFSPRLSLIPKKVDEPAPEPVTATF